MCRLEDMCAEIMDNLSHLAHAPGELLQWQAQGAQQGCRSACIGKALVMCHMSLIKADCMTAAEQHGTGKAMHA